MLLKQTKTTREKLPLEDIGVVMIVSADEKMSVGIVVRSTREIEPGDLAEMRRETAKGLTPLPAKLAPSGAEKAKDGENEREKEKTGPTTPPATPTKPSP